MGDHLATMKLRAKGKSMKDLEYKGLFGVVVGSQL